MLLLFIFMKIDKTLYQHNPWFKQIFFTQNYLGQIFLC